MNDEPIENSVTARWTPDRHFSNGGAQQQARTVRAASEQGNPDKKSKRFKKKFKTMGFGRLGFGRLGCNRCPETNANVIDLTCSMDITTQVTEDCGKRKSCKVKPDKNRYTPDPCSGKSKYVTVDYECEALDNGCTTAGFAPDPKSTLKDGECKQIECPALADGQGDFDDAKTGDTSGCQLNFGRKCTVTCEAGNDLVGYEGGKKESIEITCSGDRLTNVGVWSSTPTWENIYDYVPVCMETADSRTIICHGKTDTLTCTSGTIKIVRGYYGRKHNTGPGTCNDRLKQNKDYEGADACESTTSLATMKSRCDGQSSCTMTGGLALFGGDPCSGEIKHILVDWSCDT